MNATGHHTTPIVYEIVVHGGLAEAMGEQLGAHAVESHGNRTLIVIEIVDQSHLAGVLNRLNDLNIPIESVNPRERHGHAAR